MSACEQSSTTGTGRRRSCASKTSSGPVPEGRRGARQVPRDDGHPVGLRLSCSRPVLHPFLHRPSPSEAADPRDGVGRVEVEAVGAAVTEFEVGDAVFGDTARGANAEYVCVRESATRSPTSRPASTFEEAAAVSDGACIALACLAKAESPARSGASSSTARRAPIGTAAVQLAKASARTSPPCATRRTSSSCATLGADEVIDYLHEDFTKNGMTYDVIFDAVGKHSFRRCRRSLKPGGIFLADRPRVHVARAAPGPRDTLAR